MDANKELTAKEKYWWEVKEKNRLISETTTDKLTKSLSNSMNLLIDMVIRYENLKCPNEDIVCREAVINVIRPLSKNVFTDYKLNHFNGVNGTYIIIPVLLVKEGLIDHDTMFTTDSTGIDYKFSIGNKKTIIFTDKHETYEVYLMDIDFVKFNINRNTNWEYVYFDEG